MAVRGSYHCGPGDILDIRFFEIEELDRRVAISASGEISLPLIAAVDVAGDTTAEIEAKLVERYSGSVIKNPQISVGVAEFRSRPVTVIGAVREPASYQLRGERRLLEVVAMAGGFDEEVGRFIRVQREGEAMLTIAVAKVLADPGGAANVAIEAHDLIEVERAGIVYVLGAVEKAGGFPLRGERPMTVLRALSLAQGLAQFASPQQAVLIRNSGTTRQEIPVALRDILRGRRDDISLVTDDILWVPDSRAKSAISRGTEAAIQMATGIVVWRR